MSSNSTSQRENEANGSSVPSEVVTIRRGPAIIEELLDNLENIHFTDDADGLEQTLTALDPTLQDAYMEFGIFDSTTISRCRRVVSSTVEEEEEEEDSDSEREDEEVAAVAVRPFSRLAAVAVRRRSGVRRGSQSSSRPPAQVPTFKEHDDVEKIARPSSSENDNALVEPAAPPANSDRARAA